jgi:hypothetical protein
VTSKAFGAERVVEGGYRYLHGRTYQPRVGSNYGPRKRLEEFDESNGDSSVKRSLVQFEKDTEKWKGRCSTAG